ncbi:hypothetical protein M422DRAFT_195981, partial [Sphaerobolus stellatus SS14]
VVEVIAGSNQIYGFKVINHSHRDFYLNAFYFDNMDFSITPYYLCHKSRQFTTDPTVRAGGGSFTVGYGSGGERPCKFTLGEDVDIEVGFLKIYLTSENVNLSSITQCSPFDNDGRTIARDETNIQQIAGTILLKIIQRRYWAH